MATRVRARNYVHDVLTQDEEQRIRKSPQQSPPNIAMHDWKPLRIRTNGFETSIDLVEEFDAESPHTILVPIRCVFNV